MQVINILGVPFDVVHPGEALEMIIGYCTTKTENRCRVVVTPNPEAVMMAQKDAAYRRALCEADLRLADGIGIVLASRLTGGPLRTRVRGCDTAYALLARLKDTPYTVYLLGAAPGVAAQAKANMEKKYPGLSIVGVHDGYFDANEEKIIQATLQRLQPDILLLGMAMPRQEQWAWANRHLPVKVMMCLGGTLDVMSGKVKRAPVILRRLGLEWFYRLVTNPRRAKRMLALPKFALAVMGEKMRKNK